jgi:hypothetical protein
MQCPGISGLAGQHLPGQGFRSFEITLVNFFDRGMQEIRRFGHERLAGSAVNCHAAGA